MPGQLLTADQVAKRWQVPTTQVYRLTRDGVVPTVKLGKYYRYKLDAIERFEAAFEYSDPTTSRRTPS
jgi:excisionase family DNA binding protein